MKKELMQVDKLCLDIYSLEDSINVLFKKLPFKDISFFSEYNSERKQLIKECSELSFVYCVAYLYNLYVDRSNNNIQFTSGKFHLYGLDKNAFDLHTNYVHAFRTYFFHYLNYSKDHDKKIARICYDFYDFYIRKFEPKSEKDWEICLLVLLEEAKNQISNIFKCLENIVTIHDQTILADWSLHIYKNIPQYRIEEIAMEFGNVYGVSISANSFISKNLDVIRTKLIFYSPQTMLEAEEKVKDIIDELIQDRQYWVCPLRGDRIKDEFKVTKKEIGEIKRRAMDLHSENPALTVDDLIRMIKDERLIKND